MQPEDKVFEVKVTPENIFVPGNLVKSTDGMIGLVVGEADTNKNDFFVCMCLFVNREMAKNFLFDNYPELKHRQDYVERNLARRQPGTVFPYAVKSFWHQYVGTILFCAKFVNNIISEV